MGLFDRLFKKDPRQELDNLETQLRQGMDLEKGLKIAAKLATHEDQQISSRASGFAQKIKANLAAELIEKASRSEANGFPDDAADWLKLALHHLDGSEKSQVYERMQQLLSSDAPPTLYQPRASAESHPEEGEDDLHFEDHFEMLLGMFTEEAAERYQQQTTLFHEAFVIANNGSWEPAIEILDRLLSEYPDNPTMLFERARYALAVKDPDQAQALLERAWPVLGDDYIDENKTLSVPVLWGEAMLQLGRGQEVADRIAHLADPRLEVPTASLIYARALETAERLEEATKFLVAACKKFHKNSSFYLLLARVMERQGKWQQAIEVLETIVKPTCNSGNCDPTPKHPPSMRALISLYLSNAFMLDRAKELFGHLEVALSGHLTRADLLLLSQLYKLQGDPNAAAWAETQAATLSDVEDEALHEGPAKVSLGESAVL